MNEFEHDSQPQPRLSPDDAALVDRLLGRVDAIDADLPDPGNPPSLDEMLDALPVDDRPRAEALRGLLGQLDRYPVGDADDALVDATMARIDRVDRDLASLPLTEMRERHRAFRFRVPDLVGLAAAILLAFGVLMPVTHRMRMASIDTICSANMRTIGMASQQYANDFDGWLPMRAGLMSWDRTPSRDNVSMLHDHGYCDADCLNCPGHDGGGAHGGYAFRALDHSNRARILMAPPSALMADRSNVLDFAKSGSEVTNMVLPSSNHGHRGQFVLLGTLEVRWVTSPVIEGVHGGSDNIYLIQLSPGNEALTPGQRTIRPEDHFTH